MLSVIYYKVKGVIIMKTALLFSILLCVIALPAFSETPESSVETDIAVIKTEIKNLKENVNNGFDNVQKDFNNVQKSFDRQNNIIIACIGIPLAILAIGATVWGILANRRGIKYNS